MTHGINTVQRSLKEKKRQFNNFKTIYPFQKKKIKGALYSLGFMFIFLKFRCCQNAVSLKTLLLRLTGGSFWIIFLEYILDWKKKKREKSKLF